MSRHSKLLEKGFFPSQVPPCFSSVKYASKALPILRLLNKKNKSGIGAKKCIHVRPETFSVARIGHTRRLTSIVNPITQFYLTNKIANNWKKLQKHYLKSELSLSTPSFIADASRAVSFTPIRELQEKKVLQSAGFKYVLISDISMYFPTIYTHTIGWALDGKEKAKNNQYKKSPKDTLGNLLDKHIRYCQSNQTIGLPIGPDTSHIVSEIIGTGIDVELKTRLGEMPAGFRFVDDFYLYFESREKAEEALAQLSNSIAHYELKINSVKTRIMQIDELSEETWKYPLQQFQFESLHNRQKNSINHYFDLALSTAKKNLDENVMIYAMKRVKHFIIKKPNWDLFEAYLCRTITAYPNTIQEVAHILTTYNSYGFIQDKSRLGRTLNQIIKDHAAIDHHSEVAWALWLCNQFKIRVEKASCIALEGINSSICLIQLFDLNNSGLLVNELDQKAYKTNITIKELWGTYWLFAYEAARRGWANSKKSFLVNDSYYGVLDKYDINFYDPDLQLEPIFKPVENLDDLELAALFESDDDILGSFDFIEDEGDYATMQVATEDDFENLDELEARRGGFDDFEDDIPF